MLIRYTSSKKPKYPVWSKAEAPDEASEKAGVLVEVVASPLSKRQVLAEMGIPRRTYYNWGQVN